MSEIIIKEHSSSNYSPRTYQNAKTAHITVAIAVDFNTAGERCTHKAAGTRYIALDYKDGYVINARKLYRILKTIDFPIINIAGNGIYTFKKYGVAQEDIDSYLYGLLSLVHLHHPISKIVSGGQTGMDIAGAVVGVKLGIPIEITFPKGYLQRNEKGVDFTNSEEDIRDYILTQAKSL